MSPPRPQFNATASEARQAIRRPRATDGVGNALRQVYGGPPALPRDLAELLDRLSDR